MAFRSQKAIGAFLAMLACGTGANGEPVNVTARHRHFRKGGTGEMRFDESSVSFRESGKKPKHSREWAYDEIQQMFVGSDTLRILTYEDAGWKLGSDREYEFDQLPHGTAAEVLRAVRGRIDERRLVVAIPDVTMEPLWRLKTKLLNGRGGSEGVVVVGERMIVYHSSERNESRTWPFKQIENVSRAGPFDLTITTFERDASRFGGRRDFRFHLKAELDEDRYNALWRRLNESRTGQSSIKTKSQENPNE